MLLIKVNQDNQTLVDDLFDMFKQHLRVLHTTEDDTIRLYLAASIEGIATFASNDIFLTEYQGSYNGLDGTCYDYAYPSNLCGWYCGKINISEVGVFDGSGADVTQNYQIDYESGMFYPHPLGAKFGFKVGYLAGADVPPHLTTIIFRYAAHLFENRESIRVGEPKLIPDWVNYAIASIWKPRV